VEVVGDGGAEDSSGVSNSYKAEITPGGVVGLNQLTVFVAKFTELNADGETLGSAKLTIDEDFVVDDTQSLEVSTSSGKQWTGGLAEKVLSLWANDANQYLGQNESVSVVFRATTPATIDPSGTETFTFVTEAWTTANDNFNGVPSGVGNNIMATGYSDPTVTVSSTIQDAINSAASGDTIKVHPHPDGTYTGNININKSLTLIGDPGDATPGPGQNAPVIDGDNSPGDAFKIANGVSDVSIKGFEMRNFASNANGIGNGVSAWVTSTSNISIEDNYFHDLGWNGVMVGNDGAIGDHSNWLIKNNVLEKFHAYGFELTNTSNSSIENNIIHSDTTFNPYTCILIQGWRNEENISIKNNLIDGPFTGKGVGFPVIYVRAENGVNLDNITIQQNGIDVTGTAQSITLSKDGTGSITNVAINYNRLSRLQLEKIYNNIDATNNFWGNANGPINSSVNTYNRGQQAGYITTDSWSPQISPWWQDISGEPGSFTGTSFSPITNNEGKMFAKLGGTDGAIANTAANGTLTLEAGTYGENVEVPGGKPLTIQGQNGMAYIGYSKNAQKLKLKSPITFSNFSAYSTATNIEVNATGTIQNGIDFAVPGGTVKVAAGTYTQDVFVPEGKSLTLRNTSGTSLVRIAAGNKLTLASPVTLTYFKAFDAGTLTQINPGGRIQNGIDFAASGGTVNVAPGTYTEVLNITDKGLTISGASQSSVIVQTQADNPSTTDNVFTINAADKDITIENLTIRHGKYGIRSSAGNVSVMNCTFNHNGWDGKGVPETPTQAGMATFYAAKGLDGGAMRIENSQESEIAYCTVYENDRGIRYTQGLNGHIHHNKVYKNIQSGIYLAYDPGCKDTVVEYNESYQNMNNGILVVGGNKNIVRFNDVYDNWNTGIQSWWPSDLLIQGNTVLNNSMYNFNGEGSVGGDSFGGIDASAAPKITPVNYTLKIEDNTVTDNQQGNLDNATGIRIGTNLADKGIVISGNTVSGHEIGIEILGQADTTFINNNSIKGNTLFGVRNETDVDVDATLNWWGDASGPEHADNPDGVGDKVSDNVLFGDWLLEDPFAPDPDPDLGPGDVNTPDFDAQAIEQLLLPSITAAPTVVSGAGTAITPGFVTQGTAADLAGAKDAYQAAQQALNADRANMTPAEIAVAELDLAVANAAILALELVLGTGATSLAAAVAAYQTAVAAFAANGGLLSPAQQAAVAEVLAEVAAALTARGAVL